MSEAVGSRRSESASPPPSWNDSVAFPWLVGTLGHAGRASDNHRGQRTLKGRPVVSEPVFPPSGGTLWRESRMDFDADDFARLAHDLYDQPNLETTLDKIVESAVAVLGCDYAGLLVTSKGHQLVAITATDPAAEKADKLQIELQEGPGIAAVARGAHDRGRRHSHGHALAAVGGRDARPPPGKCAGDPAVDLPVNARRIELVCRSPTLVRRRRSRRRRSPRPPCLTRIDHCETRGIFAAGHRRTHADRPGPRHPHGTVWD